MGHARSKFADGRQLTGLDNLGLEGLEIIIRLLALGDIENNAVNTDNESFTS